jgi:hypothetical protein
VFSLYRICPPAEPTSSRCRHVSMVLSPCLRPRPIAPAIIMLRADMLPRPYIPSSLSDPDQCSPLKNWFDNDQSRLSAARVIQLNAWNGGFAIWFSFWWWVVSRSMVTHARRGWVETYVYSTVGCWLVGVQLAVHLRVVCSRVGTNQGLDDVPTLHSSAPEPFL